MDDYRFGAARSQAKSAASSRLSRRRQLLAAAMPWSHGKSGSPMAARSTRRGASSPVSARTAALIAVTPRPPKTRSHEDDGREPLIRASFTVTILGAVLVAAMLACVMYIPLEQFSNQIISNSLDTCRTQTLAQRELITNMVMLDVTPEAYDRALSSLVETVHNYVQIPPDKAIDDIWTTMRTQHKFHPNDDMSSTWSRERIEFQAWAALQTQWTSQRLHGELLDREANWTKGEASERWTRPYASQLYVAFDNGALAGMRLTASCTDPDPNSSLDPACHAEYLDVAPDGAPDERLLRVWEANKQNGDREGAPQNRSFNFQVKTRPWYQVQSRILAEARDPVRHPGGPESVLARRAWSELYFEQGSERHRDRKDIGISWTAPVALCGNYSCFQGVAAADIPLKQITHDCNLHLESLARILQGNLKVDINQSNSNVFLVNMDSRNPAQEGVLLGAANSMEALDGTLTLANESRVQVVAATSMALLARFGSWDRPELRAKQSMTFKLSEILGNESRLVGCNTTDLTHSDFSSNDCFQVGTTVVELDKDTCWLVVAVLPLGAFAAKAQLIAQNVDAVLIAEARADNALFHRGKTVGHSVFILVGVISLILGCALDYHVTRPLRRLQTLMKMLLNLDFAHDTKEFAELTLGRSCRIRDVGKLQRAFARLSRGIEAFSRFVPEPVVRNIVRGDESALRVHVAKRQVTIMFTDIRDFTAIAQDLRERDVLFVLTRYFTVMTRVVELYEGVISEILTDGLLVFWNTPHSVEDHASKACAAALAQHRALARLNAEFARAGLPQLSIRIGIHTGDTLSGNLGSETKMKFGCLGDPVNLTSRIQGLTSRYGVGTIFTAAVHQELSRSEGFVSRRLDLVQVKGKKEPITIYELVDREDAGPSPSNATASLNPRREQLRRYEMALSAYQKADFPEAFALAGEVLDEDPHDVAAALLRERAGASGGLDGRPPGLTEREREGWTGVLSMLAK